MDRWMDGSLGLGHFRRLKSDDATLSLIEV